MSGFEAILDQERPKRLLTTILRKGVIPHSLLFTGIKGVGRKKTAMTFAMACNCIATAPVHLPDERKPGSAHHTTHDSELPCGRCRSCGKILSGNHPDIINIKPDGAFIKIGQIRSLCSRLVLKPYEASMRVVIIHDAQCLNPEASNALLKALEEPPDRTIFILLALQTSDLIPTIVSRCQHIRFNLIAPNTIEALLSSKHDIDPEKAMIAASMANGSVADAFKIAGLSSSDTDWVRRRDWLIDAIESLSSGSICLGMAFAEKLSKQKALVQDSLEIIMTWLRDLVIVKYDPEKIIYHDLNEKIQDASRRNTVNSILRKIKAVQAAQKSIEANFNARLVLERLIMQLA